MTLNSKTLSTRKKERKRTKKQRKLQTRGRICQELKIFVNLITAIFSYSFFSQELKPAR
jgi:hypothetical protein